MVQTIFLPAGVPDPKRGPDYAATADPVAIAAAVSALVYVTLGRRLLVWGGHPAITPMIQVMARDLGADYGAWVRLYQSSYFEDEFPEENKTFKNVTFTERVPGDRAKSLELMRYRMFTEHKFEAAVFVGGMRGIIDEFDMFHELQPKARLVPIASTGGAVLALAQRLASLDTELRDNLNYVMLLHRQLRVDVRERRFARPEDQPARRIDRFETGFKHS
jgi:hypothetical protein